MRAAEDFSVSVPLSAAAIRDAIVGVRFVARNTQSRLEFLSSRASANFVLTAFEEVCKAPVLHTERYAYSQK